MDRKPPAPPRGAGHEPRRNAPASDPLRPTPDHHRGPDPRDPRAGPARPRPRLPALRRRGATPPRAGRRHRGGTLPVPPPADRLNCYNARVIAPPTTPTAPPPPRPPARALWAVRKYTNIFR